MWTAAAVDTAGKGSRRRTMRDQGDYCPRWKLRRDMPGRERQGSRMRVNTVPAVRRSVRRIFPDAIFRIARAQTTYFASFVGLFRVFFIALTSRLHNVLKDSTPGLENQDMPRARSALG